MQRPLTVELVLDGVGFVLPGGRTLFDAVDLRLTPGDAVAVTGPSGTGKSTLLAVAGGLLTPTAGTVTPLPDTAFAWVLQTLNTLGARSALANACLFAVLDGMPPASARRRAAGLLTEVGLAPAAGRPARTLSGGELQRLAVVRALTSTRPVVVADEPTNQLDRENAARVMDLLLGAAAGEQRAVVVVTHDVDALPGTCRVLGLGPGGLVARTTA